MNEVHERIRRLRQEGLSERQIASALGVTRHKVRTTLEGYAPRTPIRGATWVEDVELHFKGAVWRPTDEADAAERLVLGEIAYDVAEWLDAHEGDNSADAQAVVVSLRHVVRGAAEGSNPLVRLHARRARRRLARLEGRDYHAAPIEPEIAEAVDGLRPPAPA